MNHENLIESILGNLNPDLLQKKEEAAKAERAESQKNLQELLEGALHKARMVGVPASETIATTAAAMHCIDRAIERVSKKGSLLAGGIAFSFMAKRFEQIAGIALDKYEEREAVRRAMQSDKSPAVEAEPEPVE